jgi:hypothetical protein
MRLVRRAPSEHRSVDANELASGRHGAIVGTPTKGHSLPHLGHVAALLESASSPLRLDQHPLEGLVAVPGERAVVALPAGLVDGRAEAAVHRDRLEIREPLDRAQERHESQGLISPTPDTVARN